jgi:BMFP domain-containing protein YqiC
MVDKKTIQDISQKIKNIVADSPISDIEENINALLKGMFTKMDLITREEFDVQTGVLKKTREKLEAIEKKLSKIEKGIK